MKRLAAIVVIAALVLTMSVGTAFAGSCVGMACSGTAWKCAEVGTAACPMDAATSDPTLHSSCRHGTERDVKDAVSGQPAPEQALVAVPFVVPEPPLRRGVDSSTSAADARGAPHLTVVIRI